MKKFTLFLFACVLTGASLFAQSPLGKWQTVDDVTGKVRSTVEIFETGGKLYAKIVDLHNRTADEVADPVCDKCTDYRKNQKVRGMMIVTGLKKNGSEWSGGKILDPKNGKIYDCYISMENADKLKVRGYMGVSALGRTQYWNRVK